MNLLIRQLWVKNLIIFRNIHCLYETYFNSEMSLYTLSSQVDKYSKVNRSYNELTFLEYIPYNTIFLMVTFWRFWLMSQLGHKFSRMLLEKSIKLSQEIWITKNEKFTKNGFYIISSNSGDIVYFLRYHQLCKQHISMVKSRLQNM